MRVWKATAVAASGALFGLAMLTSSASAHTGEAVPGTAVVTLEPVADGDVPLPDRKPAVHYTPNPHVGNAFDPVEDASGKLVYPEPVRVKPGE